MNQEIKVLGEYVLIKQTMTPKKGKIIMSQLTPDPEKHNFTFEIVQVGQDCKNIGIIKAGDKPVFESHVQFHPVRLLENTNKIKSSLLAVHENSIIAIDNTLQELEVDKDGTLLL